MGKKCFIKNAPTVHNDYDDGNDYVDSDFGDDDHHDKQHKI